VVLFFQSKYVQETCAQGGAFASKRVMRPYEVPMMICLEGGCVLDTCTHCTSVLTIIPRDLESEEQCENPVQDAFGVLQLVLGR